MKSAIEDGSIDPDRRDYLQEELPRLGRHASEREQDATDAERESKTVKLLEHMRDRIGDELDGYVTSVLEFGCFVQIENTLEGLIHVSDLDDFYVFDEDSYTLRAESGDRVIHIGDHVRVQVARVDVPKRELDFELLEILESQLGDYSG